jgi:hypothetical protein
VALGLLITAAANCNKQLVHAPCCHSHGYSFIVTAMTQLSLPIFLPIPARRSSANSKSKQVGGGGGGSSKRGGSGSSSAAAAARAPSAEEVARRREQLAAAAEARLKALQQKQQLWSVWRGEGG